VLAGSVLSTASAQETKTQASLLNPGFEEDVLACAGGLNCYAFGITGWLVGPNTVVQKMSTVQYPDGVPGGVNVAAIGNQNSTGSILQVTPLHVVADNTYTLKLSVGHRADFAFTGYFAALMAGNVVLAYDNSLSPAAGTFQTDVIVYKTGNSPPQFSQPITIFVKSFGTGQVDIDDVSLTDVDR
jgi:hypothetical protein